MRRFSLRLGRMLKGPRRPYYTPVCFSLFICKICLSIAPIVFPVYKWPMKHALRQMAYLPNQNLFVSAVYLRRKLTFTLIFFVLPVDHAKYVLLCLNPVKLFPYFGHSAAPNPFKYGAALVLYGTRVSVGGLNGWKYEWLALSPKFNVKQHRWRENSCVFQVEQ